LAWEILNVFAMYQMGFWWVLYPFPCDVLAVYLLGTPALAPSDSGDAGDTDDFTERAEGFNVNLLFFFFFFFGGAM